MQVLLVVAALARASGAAKSGVGARRGLPVQAPVAVASGLWAILAGQQNKTTAMMKTGHRSTIQEGRRGVAQFASSTF